MVDVTRVPTITISPTAPGTPELGDLWWSPTTGQQYVWFDDGNSIQWVISNWGAGRPGLPGSQGIPGPEGPPGIGTITAALAGEGLLGGGDTGDVTLSVDNAVVASVEFVNQQTAHIPPMRPTAGGVGVPTVISSLNYSHFCRPTLGQNNRLLALYYRGEQHGINAQEGVCKYQTVDAGENLKINGDYAVIPPGSDTGTVTMNAGRIQFQSLGVDLTYMHFTVHGTINGVAGASFDQIGPDGIHRAISPLLQVITFIDRITASDNMNGDCAVNLNTTPSNIELQISDDGGRTMQGPYIAVNGMADNHSRGYQCGIGARHDSFVFMVYNWFDTITSVDANFGRVNYKNGDLDQWSDEYPLKYVGLVQGANVQVDPRVAHYTPFRELHDGSFISMGSWGNNSYCIKTTGVPELDPVDGVTKIVINCIFMAGCDHAIPNNPSLAMLSIDNVGLTVTLPPGQGDKTLYYPVGMAVNISGTTASDVYTKVNAVTIGSFGGNPVTVVHVDAIPGPSVPTSLSRLNAGNFVISSINVGTKTITLDASMGDARKFFPVNFATRLIGTTDSNTYSFVTANGFAAGQTTITVDSLPGTGAIPPGTTAALRQRFGPSQVISGSTVDNSITVPYDQRTYFNAGHFTGCVTTGQLTGVDGFHKIDHTSYDAPSDTTKIFFSDPLKGSTSTYFTHITSVYLGEMGFDMLTDVTGAVVARSQAQLTQIPKFVTNDQGNTWTYMGETNCNPGAYASMTLDFIYDGSQVTEVIGGFERASSGSFFMLAQNAEDLLVTAKTYSDKWRWLVLGPAPQAPNSGYPGLVIFNRYNALITWAQESSNHASTLSLSRVNLGPVLNMRPIDRGNVTVSGSLMINPVRNLLEGLDLYYAAITKGTNSEFVTYTNLDGFRIFNEPSFGALSSVTNNRGFVVGASATHGTNNYGFHANLANNDGATTASAVTTIAIAAQVVTITTAATHNYIVGQTVSVSPTPFNASSMVVGAAYIISIPGDVDWTALGASNNSAGTVFVASAPAPPSTGGTVIPVTVGSGIVIASTPSSTTFTYAVGNLPGTSTPTPDMVASAVAGTIIPSTRYNFYALGTAPNYFGGFVGIAATVVAAVNLRIQRAVTGNAIGISVQNIPTVNSDVTTFTNYHSGPGFQAAPWTILNLYHFRAIQGSVSGGPTTINSQHGLAIDSTMIDATNNYGVRIFTGAAVAAGKAFYGFRSESNVATGGGTTWGFFNAGTANNAFNGLTRFGGITVPSNTIDITGSMGRGNPAIKTADFTVASTDTWLINNKAGSTCTVTLPSAASFPGREIRIANYQAQTVVSASANVVPSTGGAAATAILPATSGSATWLISDGANWRCM